MTRPSRLVVARWAVWCFAILLALGRAYAADQPPGQAASNRFERLRSAAMANAYYLRSAYLRHTATYAAQTKRELPDARDRICDAIYLLGRALECDPDSAYLWWEYAALNNGAGNVANVVNAYEHLAVVEPTTAVINKLGYLYELRGEPDKAVATYARLLTADASNVVVREQIANVYVEQGLRSKERGDDELAREQFRRAQRELAQARLLGGKARLRLKEALLNELLGDEDAAIEAYKDVQALDSADPEPRVRLSKIHYARGERAHRLGRGADADIEFALAINCITNVVPSVLNKPDLLNYTAYVLARSGSSLDLAEQLVRAAIQQDEANGAYIDTLGWVNFQKGSFTQALANVLRARELEGDDPVIADHLGDIYLKLGQPDKAREMWLQSLWMDTGNQIVKDKLKTYADPAQ